MSAGRRPLGPDRASAPRPRGVHGRALALAVVSVMAATAAACGTGNDNANPFPNSRDTTTTLFRPTTTTTKPPAQMGSTIILTSPQGGVIKAQATGVVNPATGTSTPPQAGTRYLAVSLTLTNDSQVTIAGDPDGDPTIEAFVVSSAGEVFPNAVTAVAQCSGFPHTQVNLHPGQTASGCLVFDVTDGVQIVKFEFSPTQAFGQTGTWLLSS